MGKPATRRQLTLRDLARHPVGIMILLVAELCCQSSGSTGLALVVWGVVVVMIVLNLVLQKETRREYRRRNGLCLECGYDVRACSGRCSECGTPMEQPARAGTAGGQAD